MKKIGVILGSGLSGFKNELENPKVIYTETGGIHTKEIIEGKIKSKNIIVFTGRNHFYETSNKENIFKNINIAKDNNIDFLIITNAAGGINPQYEVSDLMLIKSHINFFQTPLIENNIYNFDKDIIDTVHTQCINNQIKIHLGTYMAIRGPNYETKAEAKFIKKMRVDAIGMSTIPDILKAKSYGMKVLGISCITNKLKPDIHSEVTHEEVLIAGKAAFKKFSKLLKLIINDY